MARKQTIPSDVLIEARKLCALSDDPAASNYEIEQALKKAHELLLPYGLTVEEILESLHRDVVEEVYHIAGRVRRAKWLDDLMSHVAGFCDTRLLFRSGYVLEYFYVGLTSQVQRALFHAETLHEQVDYYGECRAPRYMRDIRVYKQGVVDRIANTMYELKSHRLRLTADVERPIVDTIKALPEGSHVVVLAPISADSFAFPFFRQAKVNGKIVDIGRLPTPPDGPIEVVIDDFQMQTGLEERITNDVRRSFGFADDFAIENIDTTERNIFTIRKENPPQRLPEPVMNKLDTLLQTHIQHLSVRSRPSLMGSWNAHESNPDYAIGYQHGAEIKIRAGLR